MSSNIEDNIKVGVRIRPLFYDERKANVRLDSILNSVEVSENSEEETKSDIPVFMQGSNGSAGKASPVKNSKRFYYGKNSGYK